MSFVVINTASSCLLVPTHITIVVREIASLKHVKVEALSYTTLQHTTLQNPAFIVSPMLPWVLNFILSEYANGWLAVH